MRGDGKPRRGGADRPPAAGRPEDRTVDPLLMRAPSLGSGCQRALFSYNSPGIQDVGTTLTDRMLSTLAGRVR